MDCRTALVAAATTFPDTKYLYSSSSSYETASASSTNFFTSNDPNNDCPAPTWTLIKEGCVPHVGAVVSNLKIDSGTGKLEALQNIDPGYKETVCIKGITGTGTFTHDGYVVEQHPNCETLSLNNAVPDT